MMHTLFLWVLVGQVGLCVYCLIQAIKWHREIKQGLREAQEIEADLVRKIRAMANR